MNDIVFPDADLIAYRNGDVTPKPGSVTLYHSATGFERALADTEAERIIRIADELIHDQWDPYRISYNNLPYLAWAMGVNLWEGDYWSEGTKRDWTARQWKFKSLRGTPDGFRMALIQSNYKVTDIVRPPQGFYAAPDMTKEEWDGWIRQMPEIRIYWAPRKGTRGLDEMFADAEFAVMTPNGPSNDDSILVANTGFSDQDAVTLNDGWVLLGRYAIMRHLGVDTPLNLIEYAPATAMEGVFDYDRVSTYGVSSIGLVSDEDYSDDHFVCYSESEPQLITLAFDRSYNHDASLLSLTTVGSSLTPIVPRYERNSDIGDGDSMMFSDGDFCNDITYVDREDGGDMLLADQTYLLDPGVTEPMTEGICFADVSRVGNPAYTAELQIDLGTHDTLESIFCEDYVPEEDFVAPEDRSHQERAFRAVIAAKALRDTILVAFDPVRPLQVGDYLSDRSDYADWIRHSL